MKRDPQLSKLIREGGLMSAPEGLTGKVMNLIAGEPEKKAYKPLIGRGGRIMIILFLIAIVVLSVFYSEPGGRILEQAGWFSNLVEQLPRLSLNFSFLSEINLHTGIVSALVAVFILVLSDAGINRRNMMV